MILALIAAIAAAEKYAMVFGGADGWGNYSITSDPCRTYDDLIKAGIKPENIIYMTYTTDVTAYMNPFKGMIFTDPAETTDGDWAKYGCFEHVDYTDKEITPSVFLAILSGDAETVTAKTGKENPKVLAAGPEDTVFTYFIDHGNDGIIAVGDGVVTDKQLLAALKTAFDKKLYGKWVWFMEACHSGSMFLELPDDWNIYVMTSSDAHHNAWMSNCPPDDVVAGKSLDTCLAGLWDNSYLAYLEQNPKTTIGEIVDAVMKEVAETSDQNVSEFGDMSFRDLPLSEFFGELPAPSFRSVKKTSSASTVSLDQVPLHLAKWRAIRADKSESAVALAEYEKLAFESAKREVEVMRLGAALMNEKAADKALRTPSESYSASCVRELSIALHEKCGHSFPFSETTSNLLRNICLPGLSVPNVNWNEICM
ncbi:hypothetical protein WA171_003655 [Blastocystis sp. BT1]